MAISATTIWEIRTTGSDNNGGGFDPAVAGGTDFSQQNAAQATLTAASTLTAANQVTVAVGDYTCVAGDVGNHLQITGGTATAGFYRITAVAGQVWTLDRNAGSIGQTVVGAMGGALASIGKIGTVIVQNNKVWIKSGTYSVTSTTTNISNGCLSYGNQIEIEGYNAARGDLSTTKPLIQANGINTFTLWTLTSNGTVVTNISFDGASAVSSRGLSARGCRFYLCDFLNFTNNGIVSNISTPYCVNCTATGCSTGVAINDCNCYGCVAYSNTGVGFSIGSLDESVINCLAYGNGSSGFSIAGLGTIIGCTSYGNTASGFSTSSTQARFINCISEGNGAFGYSLGANSVVLLFNCAEYNNTSGAIGNSTPHQRNLISGSSSFFTNAAGGNFTLNNTAGGGALLRALAWPASFNANTPNYLDVGAVQHQDTGGGGGEISAAYLG